MENIAWHLNNVEPLGIEVGNISNNWRARMKLSVSLILLGMVKAQSNKLDQSEASMAIMWTNGKLTLG